MSAQRINNQSLVNDSYLTSPRDYSILRNIYVKKQGGGFRDKQFTEPSRSGILFAMEELRLGRNSDFAATGEAHVEGIYDYMLPCAIVLGFKTTQLMDRVG